MRSALNWIGQLVVWFFAGVVWLAIAIPAIAGILLILLLLLWVLGAMSPVGHP